MTSTSHPPLPNEQLASAIRSAGARATPARVRVLALLQGSPTPLSHTQIEESLSQQGQSALDRVTLYRVLDSLAESGLAHKAADARGVFRFSAAQPEHRHHSHTHFRCTHCGAVFCLDMPLPAAPTLPPGFHLDSMEVDIRGECANCSHAPTT
jgi:Fur family ferric uptake transcriptional regulator